MPAKKKAPVKKKGATAPKGKLHQRSEILKKQPHEKKTSLQKLTGLGYHIVGIGASAGGLEAMTSLLRELPEKIDMAFVLVQHLAPEHQSMMSELLARETQLRVSEVKDGMQIEPDNVYIIPPNYNLGINNHTLQLMPRDVKKHLPIDYFLQSLATGQASKAIGVILSGSASDGTLGLKAIKSEGGITFAQTPETAGYDSMPASAIAAGCVDFILNPGDIARELVHIAHHPDLLQADIAANKDDNSRMKNDLEKVFMLLRNHTGNDFTYYKHNTIRRRISRRMLVHKIDRLKDYVRYLDTHPVEVEALFHDILINVTGFFRDPDAFRSLQNIVFPELIRNRMKENPLRIWVQGCSTGEEVYSIVITLLEVLGDNIANTPVQIFATDIDEQAIEVARAGIYAESISADISPDRLRRYFTKVPQGYQIRKNLRDMCVFAPQNIVKDPPFSHQDLVACRNILIYMSNMLQRKVMKTLHYALNPGGYLFLGSSESIGGSADLFFMADKENKIYKKKDVSSRIRYELTTPVLYNSIPEPNDEMTLPSNAEIQSVSLGRTAENIILNQYGPPGVVVNERLDIMQFIGRTGPYMDPVPGVASLNLIKLVHPDMTIELRVAAHEAIRDKKTVSKEGVRLHYNNKIEEITINVLPISGKVGDENYYLVIFQQRAINDARQLKSQQQTVPNTKDMERSSELEHELNTNRVYMQTIIEDLEASNEELQSANEEIQSTNEELQSTNEELETAKEELQSTNEELITVNEELESRNSELSLVNNDLRNIIYSADLPLILLNESLEIRYFSPQAGGLLNLIDSDIQRPISNIRSNLDIGNLSERAGEVIETLKSVSIDVKDDKARIFSMRIRPYRTEDNRITGVVIVFFDITDMKLLERTRRLATVVEDSNDAITVQDFDGSILAWNNKAALIYGYSEEEALNSNVSIILPKEQQQEMQDIIKNLQSGILIKPFESIRKNKKGDFLRVMITVSILKDKLGQPKGIATTERPIHEQTG